MLKENWSLDKNNLDAIHTKLLSNKNHAKEHSHNKIKRQLSGDLNSSLQETNK